MTIIEQWKKSNYSKEYFLKNKDQIREEIQAKIIKNQL